VLWFQITDASNNTAQLQYTVPFDQWMHVAGPLDDATGQMKLYANGNVVASTTTSIRPLGALDPNYFPGVGMGGDLNGQYGEYLNGWLDDVRVSNTALDPSQFLIPEPSAFALSGLAAALLLFVGRRCKAEGTLHLVRANLGTRRENHS
jgi:hypothetical protein